MDFDLTSARDDTPATNESQNAFAVASPSRHRIAVAPSHRRPMPSISHLLLFIASTDALRTPSNSRRGVITGATASATLLNAVPPAFAQGKKPRSDPSYGVVKSPAEWKEYLTDYQYFVLREGGTEPPNTSLPTSRLPTSQTERSSGRSAARRRRSLRVGGAGAEVI